MVEFIAPVTVMAGEFEMEALFDIAAPCMSGGSGGAITTLPKLYSDLSGMDMTVHAGKYLCYVSIANVLAVVLAAFFPRDIEDNRVYSMNFALRALLPMLIAGIGINSLNFRSLTEYFTSAAMLVIIIAVVGAFLGACIFWHITGLFGYEAGVTAGLCCCNIGGSGDLAVLSAANRMNLLAFASISTRIGGALIVIWIGLLYPLFH